MNILETLKERRRTFLSPAQGELSILMAGGGMKVGTLKDISRGGLAFHLSEPMARQDQIDIAMGEGMLPDLRRARVVSSEAEATGCIIRAEFL